jgi:hypothetical protein
VDDFVDGFVDLTCLPLTHNVYRTPAQYNQEGESTMRRLGWAFLVCVGISAIPLAAQTASSSNESAKNQLSSLINDGVGVQWSSQADSEAYFGRAANTFRAIGEACGDTGKDLVLKIAGRSRPGPQSTAQNKQDGFGIIGIARGCLSALNAVESKEKRRHEYTALIDDSRSVNVTDNADYEGYEVRAAIFSSLPGAQPCNGAADIAKVAFASKSGTLPREQVQQEVAGIAGRLKSCQNQ